MTARMPVGTAEVYKAVAAFAKAGKTPTYGEVGEATGLHYRQVPLRLFAIWQWCENRHPPLPHLNAIVVNSRTRRPGAGYTPHGHEVTEAEFQAAKRKVFANDWDRVHFPDA